MRKRRVLLALVGLAAVLALGAAGLAVFLGRDPVSVKAFGQIRRGMTEDQVEAVLGRPPDERGPVHLDGVSVAPVWTTPETVRYAAWAGKENRIDVYFDGQGKVCGQSMAAVPTGGWGPVEWVREWLGLPSPNAEFLSVQD